MKAHVRQHNGTPTLFLDGRPAYAAFHLVGYQLHPDGLIPTQPIMRRYSQAGVHLYSTDVVAKEWPGPRPDSPSPYDFSDVRRRFERFLDVDPEAHFIVRMGFETRWLPGNWWNTRYPEECLVTSDGKIQTQSLASELWRAQVNDFLRAYIAHLRQVGMEERVIAYQIAAGSAGEWIESSSSMGVVTPDYGEPMRRHFRRWLRARYGDDALLRAAWANPDVALESAEVPPAERQLSTTRGLFRDPRTERDVIDFYECLAELAADDLIELCGTVKAQTGPDKLTGAFFGYLMEIAWNNSFFVTESDDAELRAGSAYSTYQRSGHLGLRRVLSSPAIDFLVSPYSYVFRGLGGDGLPMQPTESVRRAGKLYLMEEDTRMHNNFDPGGRMHPAETTMAIYRRNFCQVVTHGIGVTWMHDCGMKDVPAVEEPYYRFLERSQRIGAWALGLDRRRQAEVAVLLDDRSFPYQTVRNVIDVPLIFQQKVITLNRFGAPHDVYLLDDLLQGGVPDYRLYVFLNPWHLDAGRRREMERIVRRPGKTALWLYAPGLIGEEVSRDNMTDLTGFRFGETQGAWGPFMHLTSFTHPVTRGLSQELFWGSTDQLSPLFHVEDPEATVLGQVVVSLGRCKPGLAVKEIPVAGGTWKSVYVATPNLPSPLLRAIARWAGVHLYSDAGDVLYATPELLAVHTVSGGERTFRLPGRVEVVHELLDDRAVAADTELFDVKLEPASTSLFFTGSRRTLAALR